MNLTKLRREIAHGKKRTDMIEKRYYKGFEIRFDTKLPLKVRWQVIDPQYFYFTVYASNTLRDCKAWVDGEV